MFLELLMHDDCQVIVMDWSQLALPPLYYRAAKLTPVVGGKLAHLLSALMTEYNANATSFHVIGFSLGAHVAGFAGTSKRQRTVCINPTPLLSILFILAQGG
jgi:hypothetical protein